MSFEEHQKRYYTREINRALPVSRAIKQQATPATLWGAMGIVDPISPAPRPLNPALFVAAPSEEALLRDASCRALTNPGPGMRDPKARVGCGWWHSPTGTSVGAYGSRRGPMNPNLAKQVGAGQWIWDPQEAYRIEGQKASQKITSCRDIGLAQFPNLGWCPSTGSAVLTDGYGNPAYPQMAGGDCPKTPGGGDIIMNPADCPSSSSSSATSTTSITDLCSPDETGALSPICLQSLVVAGGCSAEGTLAQALASGSYAGTSVDFNRVNTVLEQRGFSIHPGILRDGQITQEQVTATLKGLRAEGTTAQGRSQSAALNLCYGSPFDPCALDASDSGPYDPSCVTKKALDLGFGSQGKLLPSNSGMDLWNSFGTWGELVNSIMGWKSTADAGDDPIEQASAIQNVYGLTVKYPKQDCNNYGVLLYRYYFPTWDGTLFPVTGPQTHFLGRYILKDGFPDQATQTFQDQTPAGGYLTEGQRMVADFFPTEGGTYQFLIWADDYVRLQVSGSVVAEVGCCSVPTTSQTLQMTAGQSYPLIVDLWNGGGPWSFAIQMSVNGSPWAPIPYKLLSMPQDRRKPMIDLSFHKMASGLSGPTPIADSQGVINNWQLSAGASIGSVAGRACLVVSGPGSNVNNSARFIQGVRLRGLRSITTMICVNSVTVPYNTPNPTLLSFYNTPRSNTTAYPSLGPTTQPFNYGDRPADFSLMAASGSIYPWGIQPDGVGNKSFWPIRQRMNAPPGTWVHVAYVWDEDGGGAVTYLNGVQGEYVPMTPYDVKLMMENICIGCDNQSQSWTGGIAWFRAFDYRLSADLVTRDMNDAWDSLI